MSTEIITTENKIEEKEEEKKLYLVLFEASRGDRETDIIRDWMICEGRQETYDYIKESLLAFANEGVQVDIDNKSIVLVNHGDINNAATVREFMQYMRETNKIIDETSFDIEEF